MKKKPPKKRRPNNNPVTDGSTLVTTIKQTLRQYGVVFVVVAVLAIAVVWRIAVRRPTNTNNAEVVAPEVIIEPFRRAIDGIVIDAAEVPSTYFAIIVDNQVAARPASGLGQSPLVMEVPVEGGITRFMAVFPYEGSVPKIGPVRSARPYFLDWAAEFDATFTHVGGSPDAIQRLAKTPNRNQDEFAWGRFFWRDTARQAPHNVYTSMLLMNNSRELVRGKGETTPLASWKFKDEAKLADRPEITPDISVNYGNPSYNVAWKYDREQNFYIRTRGSKPELDSDNRSLTAKNIVVLSTKIETIDAVGRRRIQVVGDGLATVYRDGIAIAATWKKSSATERLRFYSLSDDQEIIMNAGQTWIQVISK